MVCGQVTYIYLMQDVQNWGDELAEKALDNNPGDLSLILRIHMLEGENQILQDDF